MNNIIFAIKTTGWLVVSEIIFLVEEANEGGYQARALDYSIFTDAETMDELKMNVKEAVQCHFEEDEMPKMVRLHFVKDEVMSIWVIPKHSPLKVGTLNGIINDIAGHQKKSKKQVIEELLAKW